MWCSYINLSFLLNFQPSGINWWNKPIRQLTWLLLSTKGHKAKYIYCWLLTSTIGSNLSKLNPSSFGGRKVNALHLVQSITDLIHQRAVAFLGINSSAELISAVIDSVMVQSGCSGYIFPYCSPERCWGCVSFRPPANGASCY